MPSTVDLGRKGEGIVLGYLLDKGYKLVCKNFEYRLAGVRGRMGEIDLILEKDSKLHLVEVKSRNCLTFGSGQLQVPKSKINHLQKAWQFFLTKPQYQKFKGFFVQFDLAIVELGQIKIIPNAYQFDN